MKKNNRGSAFVMVLVILAIVGILAAVALWTALVNYQMKLTDIKVKNNFYSAESVLDQICVGLQMDVSDSYGAAYDEVMQNYTLMSDVQRRELFDSKYIKTLKDMLKNPSDATGMSYDLSRLKNYVYQPLLVDTALPYAEIKVVSGNLAADGVNGRMDIFETNIVLRGIQVTYTDTEGFTSIIQTDISLSVPEMKFTETKNVPDTFAYTMLGTKGIDIHTDSEITGSVYAGSVSANQASLNLERNVTFKNLQYLVADGTAMVHQGMTLTLPSQSQFWAENIVVDSATANLLGETYVADDLTLQGNEPKVKLGNVLAGSDVSGKYIGFGNSGTDPSKSSAIILNGKDSALDMVNLRELLLGGYSYIKTSPIDSKRVGVTNNNVTTGESVAIKSGQIAYLLPPEWIGVDKVTKQSIVMSNPITYEEYDNIKKNGNVEDVATDVVAPQSGKTLGQYMLAEEIVDNVYTKVFVPAGDNTGLVYYYINLPPERAVSFYRDYNRNPSEKLELYTDFYAKEIKTNASSAIYTAGNYTMYEDHKATLISKPSATVGDGMWSYEKTFMALTNMLTSNYNMVTTETMAKTVFQNLIHEGNLQTVAPAGRKEEITYTDVLGKEMKVIVANGDYIYDKGADPEHKVALIISTGNVTIKENYHGTVIAQGKIDVHASTVEQRSEEDIKSLLAAKIEGVPGVTDMAVYNLFNDGENYLLESSTQNNGTQQKNTTIPYSDIITYQNWIMK